MFVFQCALQIHSRTFPKINVLNVQKAAHNATIQDCQNVQNVQKIPTTKLTTKIQFMINA